MYWDIDEKSKFFIHSRCADLRRACIADVFSFINLASASSTITTKEVITFILTIIPHHIG